MDAGYTVQVASGSGLNAALLVRVRNLLQLRRPRHLHVQETFAPTTVGPAGGTLNVFECPNAGGCCIGIPVALTGSGILNATATKITSSNNPSKVGQPVTFTATVTAATGTTPPTGNVVFSDGATVLGTVALAGNGKASLTTSALTSGSHSVTAAYVGDSAHGASSASLTQTVQRLKSSTSLHSSDNTSTAGEAVTFTATVSGPGGTPTGSVTFSDGSTVLGTVPLSGGRASITAAALAGGPHDITAAYGGDATYAPSSDDVNQRVRRNDSNTSLASSPNPSSPGQSVTFTATVSASGPAPTGTVTFTDGSVTLGTVTLTGGTATLTTSALSNGSHRIRASYSGSDADRPSSDSVAQVARDAVASRRSASRALHPSGARGSPRRSRSGHSRPASRGRRRFRGCRGRWRCRACTTET